MNIQSTFCNLIFYLYTLCQFQSLVASDYLATEELEAIASQETLCYHQIAHVGRLIKNGADPFIPAIPGHKSACTLFFEQDSLWYLFGTFLSAMPKFKSKGIPEIMFQSCKTIVDELSEDALTQQTEQLKKLITYGLYKHRNRLNHNLPALQLLYCSLCYRQDKHPEFFQEIGMFVQANIDACLNANKIIMPTPSTPDPSDSEADGDFIDAPESPGIDWNS